MASIISLGPRDGIGGFCGSTSFGTSRSSPTSTRSAGTVYHTRPRQPSIASRNSGLSVYAPSWRRTLALLPTRHPSAVSISDLRHSIRTSSDHSGLSARSGQCHQRRSATSDTFLQSTSLTNLLPRSASENRAPPGVDDEAILTVAGHIVSKDGSQHDHCEFGPPSVDTHHLQVEAEDHVQQLDSSVPVQGQTFRQWMERLRRRRSQVNQRRLHDQSHAVYGREATLTSPRTSPEVSAERRKHIKSNSTSSSGNIVTTVTSASVTVASSSLASLRCTNKISPRSMDASSSRVVSTSKARPSTESAREQRSGQLDDAACKRSQRRREKVDELLRTEEGYLADLKALSNAYSTFLLAHLPQDREVRTAVQATLDGLIHLHAELLTNLTSIVPFSEPKEITADSNNVSVVSKPRHKRWKSVESAAVQTSPKSLQRIRQYRRSLHLSSSSSEDRAVFAGCTPDITGLIAKVFLDKMNAFNLYEEFSARCEMLAADVSHNQKYSTYGQDLDKTLESLSSSLTPTFSRATQLRKALGLKDLLIKPIQRITRYELLIRELCQLTPAYDDPISHSLLDDLLFSISQTCQHVNEARGDPERLRLLDNQRLLRQRLACNFQSSRFGPFSTLGRLNLCGVLFVAYRKRDVVDGGYAICMLYDTCLLIAQLRDSNNYEIVLSAQAAASSIQERDNGKGLQCHTTQDVFKVVFEGEGRMYEMLLAACSTVEATTWRDGFAARIAIESKRVVDGGPMPASMPSPLLEELLECGKAHGKGINFSRKQSLQRTATIGAGKAALDQVVITNVTAAVKQSLDNESVSSLPIPRSQSAATSGRVPILTAQRRDRVRLEQSLADVWTKDFIPYPGISSKRAEYNIRVSANNVMRKLSMVSIASNFSKRSIGALGGNPGSFSETKLQKARPKPKVCGPAPSPTSVNFHTAPEAFLPEDFELPDRAKKGRAMTALRALTMTSDRPRSPFPASENSVPEIKRSNSVFGHRSLSSRRDSQGSRSRLFERQNTASGEAIGIQAALREPCIEDEQSRSETKHGTRRARAMTKLTRLLHQ